MKKSLFRLQSDVAEVLFSIPNEEIGLYPVGLFMRNRKLVPTDGNVGACIMFKVIQPHRYPFSDGICANGHREVQPSLSTEPLVSPVGIEKDDKEDPKNEGPEHT
jgi:hypothetical protein